MFGKYHLTIPLRTEDADRMHDLLLQFARKKDVNPQDLVGRVPEEFYIVAGEFHHHVFESQLLLFKQMIDFLHDHKDENDELRKMFHGQAVVSELAHSDELLEAAVHARVASPSIKKVRKKILNLIKFANLSEDHFTYGEPYIQLASGEEDALNTFSLKELGLEPLSFHFTTAHVRKGDEIMASLGDKEVSGKPSKPFSERM